MVMTVPPIRKSMGWKPAERVPTTFPCKFKGYILKKMITLGADKIVPNRPREAVSGYADP